MHVLGHRNHIGAKVGALEVRHNLKAQLPHGFLLIMNQEKRDGYCCSSDEAALTQGGECDLCRLLDGSVELAADDGSHPQHRRVEGYHHADFTHV
jgi:hypothetical protein